MTEDAQPVVDVSPDALYAMLKRAMRNTLILGVLASAAVWVGSDWRNAAMLLVGTVISAASIWEWLRLAQLINARLDKQKTAANTGVVVLFFLLRLALFAVVIYGSLKFLHGSGVALLCGLALAVTTMGFEALRMLRE
jgi:ATP synthase I chain